MDERKAYEALSSGSRMRILKLLHKKPLSVEEIGSLIELQPITVRHHLRSLEDAGFIESFEKRSGAVGRPRVYYKIAKKPTLVGYPRRRYLTLSNFLIQTLQKIVGSKRADGILRRVGKSMGETVVREIEVKRGVKAWTPEAFEKFFIKGYLRDAGAEPEVLKADEGQIVYRVHNCLFFELAVKMPESMCDVLHEAFHEGVSRAMGDRWKIVRLTCQGHGDTYCEHRCELDAATRQKLQE